MRKILNLVLLLSTFLFIYGWKITSIFDFILITSLLFIFIEFVVFQFKVRKQTFKLLLYIVIPLILTGAISLVFASFYQYNDTSFFERNIRAAINFLGAYSLLKLYYRIYGKKYVSRIINNVFVSIALHSILMIVMYFDATIRLYIYDLIDVFSIANRNAPIILGLRITGVTYGLSSTSVLQMTGLILLPLYLVINGNSFSKRLFAYMASIAIFVSIILAGNAGVLIGLFLVPISIIIVFKTHKYKFVKKDLSIILLGLIVVIYFTYDNFLSKYNLSKLDEVFDFLITFGDTDTTEKLSNSINIPNNILVFFFGTGSLLRGNFGDVPSDIGYIRFLFSSGIVFSFINYLPIIFMVVHTLKNKTLKNSIKVTILCLVFSSVIFHFKEIGIYTRNIWSIQSLLFCILILNNGVENDYETQYGNQEKEVRQSINHENYIT